MYRNHPGMVLGFHACEKHVGEGLISGIKGFKPSKNDYDWLGSGMYFWENSPIRAERYGQELKKRGKLKNPMVVGAVIHLGYCFDLLDSHSLETLKNYYDSLLSLSKEAGIELPRNSAFGKDGHDNLRRNLDCAVFQYMHTEQERGPGKSFDSVRSAFWEGADLYPGAGFSEKNHIQLCIRNPNCVKGFFLPLTYDKNSTRV